MFVPVVDFNRKPLMPTSPSRARRWIRSGKATPFWKKGIFCVRLNVEPSSRELQPITVGIDPGSKKEGFTVKSEAHTYLNVQADAVTWVGKAVETRRNMRRARRFRKTPCRQNRMNRKRCGIPPSTKARWGWKLRICEWLRKMFPIVDFVVEDIKAKTKGQRRWDASFSPLEVGKAWFYKELGKLGHLETRQGYETKEMRDSLGLKKIGDKLAAVFESHCIDSWILANWWTGGHTEPDNKDMLLVTPLRFHRRQLHYLQPKKGGIRSPYGSTNSLGFKRGSLVRHLKWGLCYIGGFRGDRVSLHLVETGERICTTAKPEECKFLTYSSWRWAH
ncbi:MAG: hypothetical protein DDT29_02183 [Dehalococcoidia bacterium]|nr:hypothetical protein [Bacillota bacterium]